MSEKLEVGVIKGISENMGYIYRDEQGDLWTSAVRPDVFEHGEDTLMYVPSQNPDDLHPLTAFNHLFTEVTPLSIMIIPRNNDVEQKDE